MTGVAEGARNVPARSNTARNRLYRAIVETGVAERARRVDARNNTPRNRLLRASTFARRTIRPSGDARRMLMEVSCRSLCRGRDRCRCFLGHVGWALQDLPRTRRQLCIGGFGIRLKRGRVCLPWPRAAVAVLQRSSCESGSTTISTTHAAGSLGRACVFASPHHPPPCAGVPKSGAQA